jgi:CRISPR-associated protein Csm1
MLIVGDLSGIQDYLFDVNDTLGAQSRRLRARSFMLQTIADIAAVRLAKAAGWSMQRLIFSAAGKFLLQGDPLTSEQRARVESESRSLSQWLLKRTGARIRLSVGIGTDEEGVLTEYRTAMQELQRAKSRPLALNLVHDGNWNIRALDPIAPICRACGRQKAERNYQAQDGSISVCHACFTDLKIGGHLPTANWLELRNCGLEGDDDLFGLEVHLHSRRPSLTAQTRALFDLNSQEPEVFDDPPTLRRRLGRHTPECDFDALASRSRGAHYLGVLKMDADSLGSVVSSLLDDARDFAPLQRFSKRLDLFFSGTLQEQMKRPEWRDLYTVFSGGDDLLLVGPWDVAFRFARLTQTEFARTFRDHGLTISGGLAIVQAKTPVRRAISVAESLLDAAKHSGRNRFAAFGQVWEWGVHDGVQFAADLLSRWVEDNHAERGWLQTLLQMTERQEQEPLTAARLSYHVERNYPRSNDRNPDKSALRGWIDQRIRDFDDPVTVETRYIGSILRYALMATRKGET